MKNIKNMGVLENFQDSNLYKTYHFYDRQCNREIFIIGRRVLVSNIVKRSSRGCSVVENIIFKDGILQVNFSDKGVLIFNNLVGKEI
jgi:hypothetical protein